MEQGPPDAIFGLVEAHKKDPRPNKVSVVIGAYRDGQAEAMGATDRQKGTCTAQYYNGRHYIGDCTPTRDRGQSEVKRSWRNFEAGQAVKLGIGGSLRTIKISPSD